MCAVFITFVIMEKRLSQLLRALNLSAAQFADQIGVQRSSISHVLSGRNKPSMDFTEKILRHFPLVNVEWLITGEGSMMKGGDLFSVRVEKEATASNASALQQIKSEDTAAFVQEERKKIFPPADKGAKGLTAVSLERIVWFYSDGTFREYRKAEL